MQIGAQFYTIRDFTKDLDGLSESLKKVADIGYKTVQISGTCDFDAEWMKEELSKNGLKPKRSLPTTKPLAVTESASVFTMLQKTVFRRLSTTTRTPPRK